MITADSLAKDNGRLHTHANHCFGTSRFAALRINALQPLCAVRASRTTATLFYGRVALEVYHAWHDVVRMERSQTHVVILC